MPVSLSLKKYVLKIASIYVCAKISERAETLSASSMINNFSALFGMDGNKIS
jgi:hypothetical protein